MIYGPRGKVADGKIGWRTALDNEFDERRGLEFLGFDSMSGKIDREGGSRFYDQRECIIVYFNIFRDFGLSWQNV